MNNKSNVFLFPQCFEQCFLKHCEEIWEEKNEVVMLKTGYFTLQNLVITHFRMDWAQKSSKYSPSLSRLANGGLNQLRSYSYLLGGSKLALASQKWSKISLLLLASCAVDAKIKVSALPGPMKIYLRATLPILIFNFHLLWLPENYFRELFFLSSLIYWLSVVAKIIVLSTQELPRNLDLRVVNSDSGI